MTVVHFVLDHLWQSTVVLCGLALANALLRRNRASVRYALWFAASLKFAIPFAALGAIGAAIGSRLGMSVPRPSPEFLDVVATAPFIAGPAPAGVSAATGTAASWPPASLAPGLVAGVWVTGCLLVLAAAVVRWARAVRVVRAAEPLETGREVSILRRLEATLRQTKPLAVRSSDETIEPGVFGLVSSTLVWPRSMSEHLSDEQIETILIHELSHVRRRDNLMGLAHTAVQALFWFHPMVWWVGARLVDERERACDEDVLGMGRDRQVYAESLLKTCQFCVGAPVTSMAGVMGSDLKRRVTSIMAAPVGSKLGSATRATLGVAALVTVIVPIVSGAAGVPQLTGTGLSLPDPAKKFDAASVRQNKAGAQGSSSSSGKGNFTARSMTPEMMLRSAFSVQPSQIIGAPGWMATDRFDIVAKADAATPDPDLRLMIQNLLIERFQLKVKVETRSLPVFALVVARSDGQLGPDLKPAACETYTTGQGCGGNGTFSQTVSGGREGGAAPAPMAAPGGRGGGGSGMMTVGSGAGRGGGGATMTMRGTTMAMLARSLSGTAGRTVIDQTGFGEKRFDMQLRYSRAGMQPADADPSQNAPELFTAVQEQLGLKLEATRGPVDVLVIESANHPVNDDFEMPDQNPPAGR